MEFFSPGEAGESYDPAAFERFKQQMKASAAFIAAARKSEQKQKEKEDKLAKILLKFIQTNQKSGILMLAAKLMEENIPPSFILAIILLGNEEIQAELKREISSLAQIEAPKAENSAETREAGVKSQSDTREAKIPSEFSLAAKFENPALSLKVKAEIDSWGKSIFEAGSSVPFRVLETALNPEGNIKKVVIDCTANVLDDYLASNNMPQVEYDTCFSFCEFLMRGIMQALKKQIENQKELK